MLRAGRAGRNVDYLFKLLYLVQAWSVQAGKSRKLPFLANGQCDAARPRPLSPSQGNDVVSGVWHERT